MKYIVNRKKVRNYHKKFKLSDDTITSDKRVVAETFNDFVLVKIGNYLAKRIQRQN